MDENKISFITCVNDEEVYAECLVYINALKIPRGFEIETICIRNAQSITAAYNEGKHATDAKFKVYLHQDVFIINKEFIFDFLKIFQQEKKIGLLGVVGAKTLPVNGVWWDSDERYGSVYDSHTGIMQKLSFLEGRSPFEKVICIDGLMMITQYDVEWRADIFDGWHYYDISQSFEYKLAGYEVAVAFQSVPWVIHDSGIANISNGFELYRRKFLDMYTF